METTRFSKRVRLLRPAQFDAVFKNGKRVHLGCFTAVIASSTQPHPRIGFALSKRHAKLAVQRNRVRRLLRERFRLQQGKLSPVDLVLMLRGQLPDSPQQLVQATQKFWELVQSRCSIS